MEVTVENQQKKIPLNLPKIKSSVRTILRHEGISDAELSIVFVTHQKIRAMNIRYLGRDYATDVLAFDMSAEDGCPPSGQNILSGDVFISVDAARKNAESYETSLTRELALYVIHGVLHLLGFDDHCAEDIRKMRRKENELLEVLGRRADQYLL